MSYWRIIEYSRWCENRRYQEYEGEGSKSEKVLVADAVNLPYRTGFGDATISLASTFSFSQLQVEESLSSGVCQGQVRHGQEQCRRNSRRQRRRCQASCFYDGCHFCVKESLRLRCVSGFLSDI